MHCIITTKAGKFVASEKDWDVFHMAYMMYVPGLSLAKIEPEKSRYVFSINL